MPVGALVNMSVGALVIMLAHWYCIEFYIARRVVTTIFEYGDNNDNDNNGNSSSIHTKSNSELC